MAETSNSAIGPVKGKTYYEIQQEQAELDLAIRRRKPGLDAVPTLRPGAVPRMIGGYVWDADRAPEPRRQTDDG
jgi:hypothetical protein